MENPTGWTQSIPDYQTASINVNVSISVASDSSIDPFSLTLNCLDGKAALMLPSKMRAMQIFDSWRVSCEAAESEPQLSCSVSVLDLEGEQEPPSATSDGGEGSSSRSCASSCQSNHLILRLTTKFMS